MNRLQKKCALVTAGTHLLLVVILLVGPAFFQPKPNPDDQILDMIPANLVDDALNQGVREATPPPPAPPEPPQPPPPVVTPPLPPKIESPEPVKPVVKTPEPKVPDKPPKTEPRKIQVNTKLTTRKAPKTPPTATPRPNPRAINSTLANLKRNFSSSTTVDMPGDSTAAYANYATVVKSVYVRALQAFVPNEVANDNENTKVRVTIASDGTVLSADIISPSGDAAWDSAVQHTLDQVTFIAPFPAGATEKQRTYTINFVPQVERSLQ